MPSWKLNIFSNVVIARMEAEMRTAESIVVEYTRLTTVEVTAILVEVSRRLTII